MEIYRHRQMGWVVLAAIAAGLVVMLVSFASAGSWWAGLLAGVALLATGALFGWLTVIVDERSVTARFGIGLVRRQWELDEIVRVAEVRNPWWAGWGIRWLPGRTVYNVNGFAAVEFELNRGGTYRIGTDEPAALVAAIEDARHRA